jgi:hypothetical protein
MKAMEANLLSIDVMDVYQGLRKRGHHGPLPGRRCLVSSWILRGMRWYRADASKVTSRPSLMHRAVQSCLVTQCAQRLLINGLLCARKCINQAPMMPKDHVQSGVLRRELLGAS